MKKRTLVMFLSVMMFSVKAMSATCVFNEESGVITCSGQGNAALPTDMADKTKIKKIIIEEGVTSISSKKGGYGFNGATNVTEVILPSSLTSIGAWVFYGMSGLKKVTLPQNLQSIGYGAFQDTDLENIIIPASVTYIDGESLKHTHATVFFEGSPEIGNDALWTTKVYCSDCGTSCVDNCSGGCRVTPTACSISENGAYVVSEGENVSYYASRDLLISDKPCANKEECDAMINAVRDGKSFLAGGKFYKNLSDWASGNYERKRIYTVDEAEMVSKKAGNRFTIRYK